MISVCASLRDLLEAYGMQYSVAENGQQVLELINHSHYDLILLDLNLTMVNNLQLLRKVHSPP